MLSPRPLGSTGLTVSSLCIGTSPLASMRGLYGYDVDTERAVATVAAVFDSPISFLDTSNGYGEHGESELRIGEAIARNGGLPADFVLATKVDPDPVTGDFSGARARASVKESMDRLGLDHLQVLYLHDPERMSFEAGTADDGAVNAMIALQKEGVVEHLGVAGGDVGLLTRYFATGAFEVVLNHNRFTLLDRSAEPLMDQVARAGGAFVNAAPYGGGMLVKGPAAQPKYAYGTRGDALTERVVGMQRACDEFGVPLAAAALQFSVRDERVDSTAVGLSAPERVAQTLDLLDVRIPDALWERLAELAPPPEEWLS